MTTPRLLSVLPLLPLAVACTTVESHFTETVPAAGLQRIEATVDAGDVTVIGAQSSAVQVEGRAWGQAARAEVAAARHDANHWAVEEHGPALAVAAHNGQGGGVDFTILAPPTLATHLALGSGDAHLAHMRGVHQVHADDITIEDLGGQLVLTAAGGVEGSLALHGGDVVQITAEWGDVDLTLPWGLEYDLQVWADPEAGVVTEDLGFEAVATAPGYLAARSGRGTVHIDIVAPNGAVDIRSPLW